MSLQLGLPLAVREKELADLKSSNSERKYDVRFQGRLRPFDVYPVRLELPKYRLENGRTRAAQQDYIAKNKLAKDFFDPSRSENEEVQTAQHEILKKMAAHSEPERNLFRFFEKRDQEQPLILDYAGFVVNGNRRLCTYREIHDDAAERFSHVDIIILPKCSPKDIDELEAHLQVEPDIKQEYGWASLALTLRQKLDTKQYSEDQLSAIYELTKKEIQTKIAQLLLADEYLASRNKEGRYLELEKTEFAFDQLLKNRAKLSNFPGQQQLLTEIAFRLIDSPEGDRVYAAITDAREALPYIRSALERELFSKNPKPDQKEAMPSPNRDLFGTASLDPLEAEYAETLQALRVAEDDAGVYQVIQNEIEAKKERERAARRGNSAMDAVRKANTAMTDAVNLLSAQATTQGIAEQLDGIEHGIRKVREWLAKSNA